TRVEGNALCARCLQLAQLRRRDARRFVAVLDVLAESLGRHVDAAEELATRRLPGGAAALEHLHRAVAERRESCGGLGRQPFAAVEYHDGRVTARHQVRDHEPKARKRRRRGVERMAAVMHALLARIEKGELAMAGEPAAQLRRANHPRASRMSECGGNTFQAGSLAL